MKTITFAHNGQQIRARVSPRGPTMLLLEGFDPPGVIPTGYDHLIGAAFPDEAALEGAMQAVLEGRAFSPMEHVAAWSQSLLSQFGIFDAPDAEDAEDLDTSGPSHA